MKTSRKYRISVQRGVGYTHVAIDVPVDVRKEAVSAAKELLAAMPESTFQGDGVAITSIPGFGPRVSE